MEQTKKRIAYVNLLFSTLALVFAYILELFNIKPCRLCNYQRMIYYAIIATILLLLFFCKKPSKKAAILGSEFLLYLLIVFGICLGIFQVLVENHLVEYNSSCTSTFSNVTSPEAFLSSLNAKDLVACDKPQIKVLGLSLAGWNCLYMIFMLVISFFIRYKINLFHRKIKK